jgi:hypothetical protein
MTAEIIRLDGAEAYDLIYTEHLATLSVLDQETMHRTIMNSTRVWMGVDDGQIIAIWGLIPPSILSDTAYLWLYTTKYFTKHTFVFIRHSQRAVAEMLKEFPIIVGHGTPSNPRSLRWLKWLGAEFGDLEFEGRAIRFTIRADKWQQVSAQSA